MVNLTFLGMGDLMLAQGYSSSHPERAESFIPPIVSAAPLKGGVHSKDFGPQRATIAAALNHGSAKLMGMCSAG